MGSRVTDVCVKFNYDRFHVDRVLGNFRKSDNSKKKKKKKKNVRSAWGPVSDSDS